MINYYKLSDEGVIVGAVSCANQIEDPLFLPAENHDAALLGTHWFDGVAIAPLPQKPSDLHEWKGGVWVLNMQGAVSTLMTKLSSSFFAASNAQMVVNAVALDADAAAQTNLQGAILECSIAPEAVIPMWRAADNTMVSFESVVEYETFIKTAAAAIIARKRNNYINLWQHKEAISVATPEELLAYDVNTGWV